MADFGGSYLYNNTGAQQASGGVVPMQGTGVGQGTNTTGGFQYTAAPSAGVNTGQIAAAQMPNMSVAPGENYQSQMQDAYYNQATSRLDPQWNSRIDSEQARLANMGFSGASAARSQDMSDLYRARNDAYGSAQNSTILNSGAEAQRRQGMDIAAGNFGNQATQQNFENQLTSQQAQNQAAGQQFNQNLASAGLNNQGLTAQQNAAQGWGQLALGWGGVNNNAASIASNSQLGNRGYDQSQAQQEFNNSRQQAFDPYLLQNMAMGGMNPNNPEFGNYNQMGPPGSQLGYAGQQIGANNQQYSGVADAAGGISSLMGKYGSFGGNAAMPNPDPMYGGVGNINPQAFGGGF